MLSGNDVDDYQLITLRLSKAAVFMVGGKVAIFGGDIKRLSEDMKIVRPTMLPGYPLVIRTHLIIDFASQLFPEYSQESTTLAIQM